MPQKKEQKYIYVLSTVIYSVVLELIYNFNYDKTFHHHTRAVLTFAAFGGDGLVGLVITSEKPLWFLASVPWMEPFWVLC